VDDGLQEDEGKGAQHGKMLRALVSQLTVNEHEYFHMHRRQHANATGIPVTSVMIGLIVCEIKVAGDLHLSNLFPV
jgi:hypothetical protein